MHSPGCTLTVRRAPRRNRGRADEWRRFPTRRGSARSDTALAEAHADSAPLPQFDGFLAIGTLNREYYLRYGVAPERIFMMPYAVDDTFLRERAERAHRVREEFRVSQTPIWARR